MNNASDPNQNATGFRWGVVITLVLSIGPVLGMFNMFRGISTQKATGLGAVAGGLAEGYAAVTMILVFVLPLVAIVFLGKSLSKKPGSRSVISLLCIGWNGIMLVLSGLFVWFYFHLRR